MASIRRIVKYLTPKNSERRHNDVYPEIQWISYSKKDTTFRVHLNSSSGKTRTGLFRFLYLLLRNPGGYKASRLNVRFLLWLFNFHFNCVFLLSKLECIPYTICFRILEYINRLMFSQCPLDYGSRKGLTGSMSAPQPVQYSHFGMV